MEDANQKNSDRFAPILSPAPPVDAVDRTAELHNLAEKALPQKDERIVSANSSPNAGITLASRNAKDQPTSETSGGYTAIRQLNSYAPQEQGYYFGGYDNSSGHWDDHSNYVGPNRLHVIPPEMYNDNASLFFPPGYAFDSQMAYGQFSPLASPMSPIMFDGQLFSPHQMPVTPSYYQSAVSPAPPHATSAVPASQTDLVPPGSSSQESFINNTFFGPGSAYYLPFGSFGGGDVSVSSSIGMYNFPSEFRPGESLASRSSSLDSSRIMSPLTSGTIYPPPIGILGQYEQNVAQAQFPRFGLTTSPSAQHFPRSGSYNTVIRSSPIRSRVTTERGGRRERDSNISTDSIGTSNDWNRGPRASKPKSKSFQEEGSMAGIKALESTSGFHIQHLNSPDFITDYERAKFFVIKSFSEDNIHKSIKYSIWASTTLGNRKLDAAYRESKEMEGICPVFLFFSVNASGQFCGVAEMVGPLDFENDADYWQQDRWSGQFAVKWHIIKDVPNSRFRHILLDNNDNKPVTHSRDAQEVKLEQGIEMLKIFKSHEADTSLVDDFNFYDEREKNLIERKKKQQSTATGNTAVALATESIDQISGNLTDTLRLDAGKNFSNVGAEQI